MKFAPKERELGSNGERNEYVREEEETRCRRMRERGKTKKKKEKREGRRRTNERIPRYR